MLLQHFELLLTLLHGPKLSTRQVVTYKWLARQYAIPSNYAKK